jgi:hypothetical protein
MGQPERFTVEHRGRRISVERGAPHSASQTGGGQAPGQGEWFLTIAGTALTSLRVHPGESEAELERRVHAWLDEHSELLDRDQIHLGGG